MKIITKNSVWVSGLTFSMLAVSGYSRDSVANEYYSDTESYQATEVAGESCEITEQQQHMLDLINEARSQARSCGDELFQPVTPLTWDCRLGDSAAAHTKDMATYNFFGHTGSDGLRAGDRLLANGYDWHFYGENLGAGFVFAEEALEGFLESPSHCKNIMNPQATTFGSYRMFVDLDYFSYWTQLISAPM